MSSLRLALKQSLEESSSGFSPPSAATSGDNSNTQSNTHNSNSSNNNPNQSHHHHNPLSGLHAPSSAPPSPNAPSHRALASPTGVSGGIDFSSATDHPISPQTHKKRGPGRPRKHPVDGSTGSGGSSSMKKRGRPKKQHPISSPREEAPPHHHHHEGGGASSSENEFSVEGGGGGQHEERDGGEQEEHHNRDAASTEEHPRVKPPKKKKQLQPSNTIAGAAGSNTKEPHTNSSKQPQQPPSSAVGEDVAKLKSSFSSTGSADAAVRKEPKPTPAAKETPAPAASSSAPTREVAEERVGGGNNNPSNNTAKAKTVVPPDPRVLTWARNLPIKEARQKVTQGLRVKVRFSTRVKREGKMVRKKKWYGGLVSQVSKAGSKIRIKYDDGTSEVAKFPDKDIVVDDGVNGEHQCPADFFLPPENMAEDAGAEDDASQHEPSVVAPAASAEEPPTALPVATAAAEPPHPEEAKPKTEVQPPASGPDRSVSEGKNSSTLIVSTPKPVETQKPEETVEATKSAAETRDVPAEESTETSAAAATTEPPQKPDTIMAEPSKPTEVAADETDEIAKIKRKGRGRPSKGHRTGQEPLTPKPDSTTDAVPMSEEQAATAPHLPLLQSPAPASVPFDGLVDTPVEPAEETAKRAKTNSTQQPKEIDTDTTATMPKPPLTDVEEKPLPAESDDSPVTPKVLAIRIHKQKATSDPALEPQSKPSASANDESKSETKEPLAAATAEKETTVKESDDQPSTRIHINLKPAAGTDPAEVTQKAGRTTPVPAPTPSLKELESEIMTPTSPRGKKGKRKRAEVSPNTRSRSPKPPAEGEGNNNNKFQSAGSAFEKSTETEAPPQKDQHNSDEDAATAKLLQTPRGGRQKKEDAAARSGRRAAKEANEKISTKDEQASKKKKKRDRRREATEDQESDREEPQQAPWVQCDKCKKWRIIPVEAIGSLPDQWFCEDNVWDPKRNNCDAPQQKDKRERKRKKRQRLMEKAAAERDAPADAASEGSNERESSTASKPQEDSGAAEEGPAPKRQKKSASNDGSDSSVNNEPAKAEKKPKKPRSQPAGEPTDTQEDVAAAATATEVKRGRGRPRRNLNKEGNSNPPSANTEQNPEEGDNLEWVQCDKCSKWRKLPPHISADELPDVWYCALNTWNSASASCSAPEDKAEAGLTDIFNNGEGGAKLSYRNLIFGNGRKFNRPVSERTRAAESLFASVSEDTDAPPTVPYANSSAFISRSKMNQMEEPEGLTVLGLMSRSHLWEELRTLGDGQNGGLCAFDRLSKETLESMKDLILQTLGSKTLSGDEVSNDIQHRNWQGVPLGWAAARPHCTVSTVVMTMCELVKEGVLECMKEYGKDPEHPDRFVLVYRRNESYSQAILTTTEGVGAEAASHRCTKFALKKQKHKSGGHV